MTKIIEPIAHPDDTKPYRLRSRLNYPSGFDRVDTACVSVIRGRGEELLHTVEVDHELLVIPTRPLRVSVSAIPADTFILRVCPYTVCLLQSGLKFDFDYARCEELLLIEVESSWFSSVRARCVSGDLNISGPIDTILHPDIPPLIHSIERHLTFPQCPHEPYVEMLAELLIARILWYLQNTGPQIMSSSGLTNGNLHTVLMRIEDQLDQCILVSDLARSVSMPPARFTRAFKATLGLSPQRYILQRRVLRVQDLLEDTQMTLADAALEAGFSSQAHMTAMFARQFGITPGEYRKHLGSKAG
ncbi:helix-turn-helix transcriptional regulator [Exilibacterium tricleocarpae]|uniref:Helix-turn-helix transcriptional regulator n=1 Tax=Exilibacterium tricleocarpae TaxID=2591008 RepID=A0A545UBE9_9GAMM|nr:AraC family transcriptional regulator [Exilibacterium tricleocarpae]TQV86794.1 helix-turn-helix transcriptional regulator [Exilibacterium tricleocarpae]